MKITLVTLLLAVVTGFSFSSCSEEEELGPFIPGERQFDFTGFNKLEVAGYQINVLLIQADSFSIDVEGHAPNVDDLYIRMEGDKLRVSYYHEHGYGYPTFVRISMPDIEEFHLMYHAYGLLGLQEVSTLDITLWKGCSVNLNGNIDSLNVNIDDESDLTLAGAGKKISATVTNSSWLTAFDFSTNHGRLYVIDDSYAEIHASDTLFARVWEKSKAYYRGTPSLNSDVHHDSVFGPE